MGRGSFDVALSLVGALAIGAATFLLVKLWGEALFDGRARSVLIPFLVVGSLAAIGSGALTHRLQGRKWPGPVLAGLAWVALWQYLVWKSLQEHG